MFGTPLNINTKHPGIADGEVYIGDVSKKDFHEQVEWKTKRAVRAFHEDGTPVLKCWDTVAVLVNIYELLDNDFYIKADGSLKNLRDETAPIFRPIKKRAPVKKVQYHPKVKLIYACES
jgi:hypothetical protein